MKQFYDQNTIKSKHYVIKNKNAMSQIHPIIERAIKSAIRHNLEIPLVYQYIQESGGHVYPDENNTIGKVSNLRIGHGGNLLGTIEIYYGNPDSVNFDDVIDNIAVSVDQETSKATVDAFIVYNKEKKAEIIKKRMLKKKEKMTTNQNQFVAKQYETPLMVSASSQQDMMKKVSKILIDEFNKKVSTDKHLNNVRILNEELNGHDDDGNEY